MTGLERTGLAACFYTPTVNIWSGKVLKDKQWPRGSLIETRDKESRKKKKETARQKEY